MGKVQIFQNIFDSLCSQRLKFLLASLANTIIIISYLRIPIHMSGHVYTCTVHLYSNIDSFQNGTLCVTLYQSTIVLAPIIHINTNKTNVKAGPL